MNQKLETYANNIIENLWLGSEDAGQLNLEELELNNIKYILIPANLDKPRCIKYPNEITYKYLYVADTPDFPLLALFEECIEFIDKARNEVR